MSGEYFFLNVQANFKTFLVSFQLPCGTTVHQEIYAGDLSG
jgi:hypothetical protein